MCHSEGVDSEEGPGRGRVGRQSCLSGAMQRTCSLIHVTLFWAGAMSAMVLVSQDQVVTVSFGESATLRYSMEGEMIQNYFISWYRKTQNNIMTYIHREGGMYGPGFLNKFRAYIDSSNNQAVLEILKASERDEGVYYCAGDYHPAAGPLMNKLIFGTGTQLIVEAKSQPIAKPSVFVMRNGTNVACLVKDFYPKNINISLQSSKKIIEYDPAIVVSPSGKYNAVKLGQYGDSNSVKCSVEHNREIVSSTETEQTTKSPGDLKPTKPEIIQQTSESCHEPEVLTRKVNMTSLMILGLRLLFIKTVAVNFLLTAKLFFC
ncbi:uncharacterized protein LOC118980920 [Sturnira hondurensis]|uniref:uncharacterized protein LOC118980920 n=1 Tax=Sturnira hondurensis TaxID=192404 RepID=UPI00187998B2|nr:uncharacterized protein LOC118980920 [Sturnira hondurensis]